MATTICVEMSTKEITHVSIQSEALFWRYLIRGSSKEIERLRFLFLGDDGKSDVESTQSSRTDSIW